MTDQGYDLTFSTEIQEFGVTKVCQEKMTGAIRKQLAAFLEGFYDSIPRRLIAIFNNDVENGTEFGSRGSETRDFDSFSDYKDFG